MTGWVDVVDLEVRGVLRVHKLSYSTSYLPCYPCLLAADRSCMGAIYDSPIEEIGSLVPAGTS